MLPVIYFFHSLFSLLILNMQCSKIFMKLCCFSSKNIGKFSIQYIEFCLFFFFR